MSFQVLAPEARPCVWMSAGLISYKLCDRGFDCEHCPLDAALRGTLAEGPALVAPHVERRTDADLFPQDRLYTDGHLWVQAAAHDDQRVWRVGQDAFAAALVGCAAAVDWADRGSALIRGMPLCDIDLGMGEALTLNAPLSGKLLRANETLLHDPRLAVVDPYGEGWIAEIQGLDAGSILGLRPAAEARESARDEVFLFRRALALRLLVEPAANAWNTGGGADPLSDLRQVLGGPSYVELVSQFVY